MNVSTTPPTPPSVHASSSEADVASFCTFFLEQQCWGIPGESVREVIRAQSVTRVPLAPRFVLGLINLRGQILTVIDLRRRLGLPEPAAPGSPQHVIVQTRRELVCLAVDRMGDAQRVESARREPPPDTLNGAAREFISAVFQLPDHLLLVLDADRTADLPPEQWDDASGGASESL